MHTLSHFQQLGLLQKKFINWRSKKRSGEQIPTNLWLEAFDLCDHIKYCKVADRLGIGHGNFKKRLLLHNSSRQLVKQEQESPIFQEVDALSVKALFSSQQVEVVSPTGHVLRLPFVDPLCEKEQNKCY